MSFKVHLLPHTHARARALYITEMLLALSTLGLSCAKKFWSAVNKSAQSDSFLCFETLVANFPSVDCLI